MDLAAVGWELFRASPWSAAGLTLVLVVGNAPVGAMAAAMGGFVDAAIRGQGGAMALWLGVYAASALVEQFYWSFKNLAVQHLRDHGLYRLQRRLLERAASVPLARFEEAPFFDLLQRAGDGLDGRIHTLIYAVADLAQLLVWLGSLGLVLALIQPVLLPLLVLGGVPAVWLQGRVAAAVYRAERAHTTADRVRGHLQGLLTGQAAAAEIRLFGSAEYLLGRWRALRAARTRDVLAAQASTRIAATGGSLVSGLAYAAGMVLVAYRILHGQLSVGNYVTVAAGALQFEELLGVFVGAMQGFGEEARFLGDLFLFLRTEAVDVAPAPSPSPQGKWGLSVTAEGVAFTYPGAAAPILDGIHLTIRPGERVAIVGENGAGKSTLVKLLVGLYEPTQGSVRVGGARAADARVRTAAVFQDFVAFHLTLRENVGFGDLSRMHDDHAVRAALQRAGLSDRVADLDAYLGRAFGDDDLSGGQWQRVALARAFFRDAGLLVLDEPTATLDPLAELALFERFAELASGRTAIMVSHRLGAARLADRVLVVQGGRIVEEGHHDQLVAAAGVYAKLFEAQAQWYRPAHT